MKVKILLVTALLFTWVCACSAKGKSKSEPSERKDTKICATWKAPSDKIYGQLGKNLSLILMDPQEVKCYSIEWRDSVAKDQLEPYFAQDSLLRRLGKEEIAVLQYSLITNDRSYENDSIVVLSPYRPILDFQFRRKKETAHVVVSLSDFTWSVLYDDKKQFNHSLNSEAMERFVNYYLSLQK